MNNKFNILEWLFGNKKVKEKKREENKEEHTIDVCSDIFIKEFSTNKKNKQNKSKDEEDIIEVYSDTFITTIPAISNKEDKKQEAKNKSNNIEKETIKEEEKIDKVLVPTIDVINIKNNALEEIEKMLKDDYYKISKIKYELEFLQEEEENELDLEEANKIIDKLNKLIKEFEQIKKEFYAKHYDKINTLGTNDNYINSLIEEYKTAIKNNDIKNIGLLQIEQIEEYISIIDNMASIENDTDKLNISLEDKKDNLMDANKDIEKYENSYTSIEKINKYIENFCNEQETIINDIKRKVLESSKITKIAEYKTELSINYAALLSSTLLMSTSSLIPPTKSGNLLKIGLMAASIAGFANAIKVSTKEKKVTTKIDFIDYEPTIRSSIENISDMDKTILKSMKDIKDLRKSFSKEFEEYKNVIPEYTDLLSQLDSLEKELISKRNIAKEYDEKLKDALNKNNVKVKRLEEEHFN